MLGCHIDAGVGTTVAPIFLGLPGRKCFSWRPCVLSFRARMDAAAGVHPHASATSCLFLAPCHDSMKNWSVTMPNHTASSTRGSQSSKTMSWMSQNAAFSRQGILGMYLKVLSRPSSAG